MSYFELLSTEKDFYEGLSDDERRLYTANQEQLAAINTWNDVSIHAFVDVARILNELHRIHARYNDLTDYIYKLPNATDEQQQLFNNLETTNEDTFSMTASIGSFSAVLDLSCMDECDALYDYLSKVKMNRFNLLCDNFDVSMLIETLVNHNVY